MLLDTDIIIDWLRGRETTVAWMERQVAAGVPLYVTGITVAEVLSGTPEGKHDEREELLAAFEYIPLSFDAAKTAGRLRRNHLRSGHPIPLPDLLQAAVARTNGLVVATSNSKHFPDVDTINLRTIPPMVL